MAEHHGQDLRQEPTGQLLKRLSEETSTLVRQEFALARAELADKGRTVRAGAGLLGAAATAGLATIGAFTGLLILVLAEAMEVWLAALIVTGAWALVTAVLALAGRSRLKAAAPPVPEETVETLKEDAEWAKTQLRSGER